MRLRQHRSYSLDIIFILHVKTSTGGVKNGPVRKVDFWFSSVYSLFLHFLLGILSNSILQFHWIIAFYKLTVSLTTDLHSLFSAVHLFAILFLRHRKNWSKHITQRDLLRGNLCRCASWQPVGIQPAAPVWGPVPATHRLSETKGSIHLY